LSPRGFTATSHSFVMDWASIWTDVVVGLLIAGALAAWVPESFWQAFFFVDHPLIAKIWGPLIGPLVAVMSFVCSIGTVVLAAVLVVRFLRTGGPAMLRTMSVPSRASHAAGEPTVYTCPMHPEIRSEGPGRCPICGMDLVPASEEGSDEEHRGHDHGH